MSLGRGGGSELVFDGRFGYAGLNRILLDVMQVMLKVGVIANPVFGELRSHVGRVLFIWYEKPPLMNCIAFSNVVFDPGVRIR